MEKSITAQKKRALEVSLAEANYKSQTREHEETRCANHGYGWIGRGKLANGVTQVGHQTRKAAPRLA
jgi:hypothetical protein